MRLRVQVLGLRFVANLVALFLFTIGTMRRMIGMTRFPVLPFTADVLTHFRHAIISANRIFDIPLLLYLLRIGYSERDVLQLDLLPVLFASAAYFLRTSILCHDSRPPNSSSPQTMMLVQFMDNIPDYNP